MTLKRKRNPLDGFSEAFNELTPLETASGELLRVHRDDPVFSAALDLVNGRNVLFTGPTGSGKSIRSQALQIENNYPTLLAGTRWENIEVKITAIEVDLVPVLANLELSYDSIIQDGTSFKIPAGIAAFILDCGFSDKRAFVAEKEKNRETLKKGKGQVAIRVLHVDDFDRTQHPSIQNSFMKFIENGHHLFHWKKEDRERFMNLQCIASSNSTCGTVTGPYLAAKGVDLAIYNRFFVYRVEEQLDAEILKAEFETTYHEFIDRLTSFSAELKSDIAEGTLTGIGEISLRQLRPIVEQFIYAGLSEIHAARKLISAISRSGEENLRTESLLNHYFGEQQMRRFAF